MRIEEWSTDLLWNSPRTCFRRCATPMEPQAETSVCYKLMCIQDLQACMHANLVTVDCRTAAPRDVQAEAARAGGCMLCMIMMC